VLFLLPQAPMINAGDILTFNGKSGLYRQSDNQKIAYFECPTVHDCMKPLGAGDPIRAQILDVDSLHYQVKLGRCR